jgi:undecaprenyl phosphate-alpha-L-ara4N flippase subunit ArnE
VTWVAWPALGLAVVLGTIGQLLLKYGLHRSMNDPVGLHMIANPAMLAWLLCYGLTTLLWLLALHTIPLSQAFPILGLQFALIPIASSRLLDERVTGLQWIGVVAIVVGVALVGQS